MWVTADEAAGVITDFAAAAAAGEISALTIVLTAAAVAETDAEINAIAAISVVTAVEIKVEAAGVAVDAEITVVTKECVSILSYYIDWAGFGRCRTCLF